MDGRPLECPFLTLGNPPIVETKPPAVSGPDHCGASTRRAPAVGLRRAAFVLDFCTGSLAMLVTNDNLITVCYCADYGRWRISAYSSQTVIFRCQIPNNLRESPRNSL